MFALGCLTACHSDGTTLDNNDEKEIPLSPNESEEKIKITLDCYQGKIPHKLSEKSKKELIVFIETLIEIDSQKGSN